MNTGSHLKSNTVWITIGVSASCVGVRLYFSFFAAASTYENNKQNNEVKAMEMIALAPQLGMVTESMDEPSCVPCVTGADVSGA